MFDQLRWAEGQRRKEVGKLESVAQPRSGRAPLRGSVDMSVLPDGFVRELGTLRNSLNNMFGDGDKRALVFASATPGEGTTTIASSFARFLAMQGTSRVLLCEMNARTPTFTSSFSINGAGVTDYFTEQHDLSKLVQTVVGGELDLLHVGGHDASVIQIHLANLLPRMLDEAYEDYDTIIIDAPPIISCPETAAMSPFVDGLVMVVHAGKTKREIVHRAMDSVSKVDGKVVGVVLNRKKYYIPDFLYKRI